MILTLPKKVGPVVYRVQGLTVVAYDPTFQSTHDQGEDGRHPSKRLFPLTDSGLLRLIASLESHGYTVEGALDAAVRRIAAYRTFAELEASQREHGYVPTLRTESYRSAHLRWAVLKVRAALRERGLRVWPEQVEGEVAS